MGRVTKIDHALIEHFLARVRDRHTDSITFRATVRRLSLLLAYEATKDLTTEPVRVETPLAAVEARRLSQRVALVPILRAGLGMVDAVLDLLPEAEVRHLGFYRDERTLQAIEYYKKLPASNPADVALVLDPMLATGGSAVAALDAMQQWGVPQVKLLSILAVPEGISRVTTAFPNTEIYVCAIDSHLNDVGFIVPGLGDAGDRIFNARA
ncbi:MAG TPA: uracil phosphoribosyltransferase [Pirellulales bacterium]|jgi:uracil phosphoribosyltransferase|nr:uracil phosphoribosyltransferase [Pirellulales bacterium]